MATQADPVYFVSVTTTPHLTEDIIADLQSQIKDDYNLILMAISTTIEGLKPLLTSLVIVPQLMICSSQWTPEQQKEAFSIGRSMHPDIKTIAVPPGLNALRGGAAVAVYLSEEVRTSGLPKRG